MMKKFLERNGIRDFVEFDTFKQSSSFFKLSKKEKYKQIKHIFVDEGECLPTEMLEDLCLIYLRSNSLYSAQRLD